ncbi:MULTISPECIES: DMT family transporter [Sporosarcina]|uniref:DMT family transporter n=1 Tax=Sporosarcina TaxID=1569 RepID=UPI000590BD32|nr:MULTISPECIES: DMT family transporter [Sporosarcina]WJY27812.1 DMT family transporter [Sporosarcina sp. 0.2-SM1T-5]
MNKPAVHPAIPIIIGVISVALSAIFVKLVSAEAGVTAFYRMFFSVIFMLPVFLLKYRKEIRVLTKRDWVFSTLAGIFLAFHFIFWFESLNYTSVASSTVLVTLQPIFAFAGTYFFFKEKISVKTILSAVIAIMGSVIISFGDFRLGGSAFFGDVLALIGCALITAYLLFGQDVRQRLSLITYTFVVYSISSAALFLYVIIKGEALVPAVQSDWVWFVLLALIPNLLGHTLFNWAIRWVSTNAISIAILFEPVGASILAYYVFGESLSAAQIIGGIVVLLGILLFVADGRKKTAA